MTPVDFNFFKLIEALRPFFFSTDRDINLGTGRDLVLDGGSVTGIDHGDLDGLGDDDHPHYTRKDTLTTKGDLYARNGSGVTRLGAGSDGQILTSDSAQSTGLAWADPAGGVVPIGGIILWSGSILSIPVNWALCDGNNGTPNLTDRFVVGAGGGYAVGANGGAATVNLQHDHGPGTLATDSDSHTHGPGTLATDSDSHTHGAGSLGADSGGSHTHGAGSLGADSGGSHTHGSGSLSNDSAVGLSDEGTSPGNLTGTHSHNISGTTASGGSHTHTVSGSTASGGSHTHSVSGSTGSDAHSHAVDSGSTGSDAHSHAVDSGSTGNALSAAQSILPPYYALAYIMRTA